MRILVALVFALWAPLAAGAATGAMAAAAKSEVAMPCHGESDRGTPDGAVDHSCCFTACLPLGVVADTPGLVGPAPVRSAFAPVGATVSRTRGVDPPPPKS